MVAISPTAPVILRDKHRRKDKQQWVIFLEELFLRFLFQEFVYPLSVSPVSTCCQSKVTETGRGNSCGSGSGEPFCPQIDLQTCLSMTKWPWQKKMPLTFIFVDTTPHHIIHYKSYSKWSSDTKCSCSLFSFFFFKRKQQP